MRTTQLMCLIGFVFCLLAIAGFGVAQWYDRHDPWAAGCVGGALGALLCVAAAADLE